MKMLPAVGTCIGTQSGSFDSLQLIRSDAESGRAEWKQIPRFIGNVSSYKKWAELLESRDVRPKQARWCLGREKNVSIFGMKHRLASVPLNLGPKTDAIFVV
jgi:hypothetical protein